MSEAQEPFFFRTYVTEVMQLRRFLDFAWFGMDRATEHADFEERLLIPYFEKQINSAKGAFDYLLPEAEVRVFAREQKGAGFPLLHQLCVMRLWSVLETVVDEAVYHLLKSSEPAELPETVRAIKAPIFEFLAADADSRIQFLLDCIKQDTRASLKQGVGRFESMLSAVGYGGAIDQDVRKVLLELSEVRNVIAHRAGKVDARFLQRCSWIVATKGQALRIGRNDFKKYAAAADWYAYELLDRLLHTLDAGATPKEKLAEHRGTLSVHKSKLLSIVVASAEGEPAHEA